MHIHGVLAPWPLEGDVVACRQLSGILRQLLPPPTLGNARVYYRQPTVALDASGNQEVALTSRSPETFGAVPTVEQDMGLRACHWLKGADRLLHQRDLALERHPFLLTDYLLSIQLGSQRTASAQQHIQILDQAMTQHSLLLGCRIMHTESFHLLAFALLDRRVVPNQVP